MAETEHVQILSIRPDSVWRDGQSPVQGYRVDFRTPSGVNSFVQVPRSPDFERELEQAVADEAAKLERVVALRVKPHPVR